MASSLLLTPFQRAVLRRLAAGVSDNPSQELRRISQLMIFLVLETLEVSPGQIASILGVEVTQSLNAMLDARRVPYFGVVDPDGRIAYTSEAQQWLQEHGCDRQA